MKIVHITRGFGDYLVGLLNGLSQLAEVHVVLSRKDESMAAHLHPAVRVFKSRAPAVANVGNASALARVIRYVKGVDPDILHFQSGVVWELTLMSLFRRAAKVATVHDVTKHPSGGRARFLPQSLLDYAGRKADAVIVHGSSLQAAARSRYGHQQHVHVLPHGIIAKYGIGESAPRARDSGRVLLFGTIDRWKGVEILCEAAPLIRAAAPGVRIQIAGGCHDPAHYTRLAAIDPSLEMYLRRQSDAEVAELFRWADVVVLPYIEASQSGVLQLALAFAVPPVVTDVGALAEVVRPDDCGLVVPPRDPVALAEAVVRLLGDEQLRERIIANLVRARDGKYDWSNIARGTIRVYEDAVARRKAPAVGSANVDLKTHEHRS